MAAPEVEADLDARLAARVEALEAQAETDLGTFITLHEPRFTRPDHLAPLVEALDRSMRTPVMLIVEAPPRHGKTETILAHVARRLRYRPRTRVAYASYSGQFANRKSRRVRDLCARAGVWVGSEESKGRFGDPAQAVSYWQTRKGGMFVAGGRGGGFVGEGFDLLVIDDPFKSREEAESHLVRDKVWELWKGTLAQRLEPGASVVITHQRWNEDDLIGRLKDAMGREHSFPWEVVTLRAVDDDEQPLWPERYSKDDLDKIRTEVEEYNWWSQYMQRPRPKGGRLFRGATTYLDLPPAYEVGYGVDLAYTAKTKADHSVCIEGWAEKGVKPGTERLFIRDVSRAQVEAPEFSLTLRAAYARRKGPMLWYATGPEKGSADFIKKHVPLTVRQATADKMVRATPAAAAWNQGRILLPPDDDDAPPWLASFLDEVHRFTGLNDPNDDQVDALAALWDLLVGRKVASPGGQGYRPKTRSMTESPF